MDYKMEELLPIVARLADQYTSKESSSVPYHVARMLMEAVLYCINEYDSNISDESILKGDELPCEIAYEKGYECVIEKVYSSKQIYEKLIENFEDYGCRNYKDTITKGMPAFFLKYDADFNPQDHILTLDYPTLFMNFDQCGVDLIQEYLIGVETEKRLLDLFSKQSVVQLLDRIQPKFEAIYMDNICYPVLLNAIGCVIVDKSVSILAISERDCSNIKFFFEGEDIDKVEFKIEKIIRLITDGMDDSYTKDYLIKMSKDYAVRIWNAVLNDSLGSVFNVF